MSSTIPPDEPDGGHDESAKDGDQQRDRPHTLQIQSDGEVSDVAKQEPLTESSSLTSISPLQMDTVTEASTPGSRASPIESIAEKIKNQFGF